MDTVDIIKSTRKGKKLMAIFKRNGKKYKTVHFGDTGYDDYTIHKDPNRQRQYIARHSKNSQDWTDPFKAGTLAMWILWLTPSLNDNIRLFRDEFGFSY